MKQFIIEITVFVALGLFFTWVMKQITADGWRQGWWAACLTITICNSFLFLDHE